VSHASHSVRSQACKSSRASMRQAHFANSSKRVGCCV
jgi:hypothetical protein